MHFLATFSLLAALGTAVAQNLIVRCTANCPPRLVMSLLTKSLLLLSKCKSEARPKVPSSLPQPLLRLRKEQSSNSSSADRKSSTSTNVLKLFRLTTTRPTAPETTPSRSPPSQNRATPSKTASTRDSSSSRQVRRANFRCGTSQSQTRTWRSSTTARLLCRSRTVISAWSAPSTPRRSSIPS